MFKSSSPLPVPGRNAPTPLKTERFPQRDGPTISQFELRQVYADSAFVVIALFDVNFQAGITAILEAMAMERAVICSRTPGRRMRLLTAKTVCTFLPATPWPCARPSRACSIIPWRRNAWASRTQADRAQMNLDRYVERLQAYVAEAKYLTCTKGETMTTIRAVLTMTLGLALRVGADDLAVQSSNGRECDVRYAADRDKRRTSRFQRLHGCRHFWRSIGVKLPVSYLLDIPVGGWTDEYKTTKMVFRRIPAATNAFLMGSPGDETGRHPDEIQHAVTLTKAFYIGVFTVTQRQWELVMGSRRVISTTPRTTPAAGGAG